MIEIGSIAPDFTLLDQQEQAISLQSFQGKKVALFFYPKDNTPTCTTQACNMRDNIALLTSKGIAVIGISVDNTAAHKKFDTKYNFGFPILSDVDKEVVELYGVWAEKKFMGKVYMGTHRTTFLIDEQGLVSHVIKKIDAKNHAQQILEVWGLL